MTCDYPYTVVSAYKICHKQAMSTQPDIFFIFGLWLSDHPNWHQHTIN